MNESRSPRKTMTVVRYHAPGDLRVDEIPRPPVEAGEVLIRVAAVGICTTDRKIAARGHFKISADQAPRTLGHEVVGEVVEVGDGVRHLTPGTRVALAPNICRDQSDECVSGDSHLAADYEAFGISMDGGMAEFMLIPAIAVQRGNLLPLTSTIPYTTAVLLEPLACCYNSLDSCNLRPGESLLIAGAGSMGLLHVSIAHAFGASLIAVSDPNPERLERARALGADVTIQARKEDVGERVAQITGGRGFDVISVTAGSAQAQSDAVDWTAIKGRINLFASVPADQNRTVVDANRIHYRQVYVLGTSGASVLQMRRTLRLLEAGRVDPAPLVTGRYPLTQAGAAFEAAQAKENARVILEP